jgi:hypothetical protein
MSFDAIIVLFSATQNLSCKLKQKAPHKENRPHEIVDDEQRKPALSKRREEQCTDFQLHTHQRDPSYSWK